LLAGSTLWFAWKSSSARATGLAGEGPNVRALWSQLLRPGQMTDIVAADSVFSLYQSLIGQSLSLTDYITHNYLAALETAEMEPRRRTDLKTLLARRYTDAGDLQLLSAILPLAAGIKPGA
jgi:hypothetical protein